jgi:hypothetical protein
MRASIVLCSYCVVVALGLTSLGMTRVVHAWTDQSLTTLNTATALETPVELKFDDVPFRTAVESLCRKANVAVVWDEVSLADVGLADDETVALESDQPLALRRALALILEPCYLTWELQGDGQLNIISRKKSNDQIVTITYDVRALLKSQPDGFDLPGLIQKTVVPGDWQTDSAAVAGYMLLVDGELQVTQRRSAQKQIAALLFKLDSPSSDE